MKINKEGYVFYTPEEKEELFILENIEKGDYFEVNAKILKVLYDRYPKMKIGSHDLLYNSRDLFYVVDESKKLKPGTSRKKQYFMTYEKKIADVMENNVKAIDALTLGFEIRTEILTFNEYVKLRNLKFVRPDERRDKLKKALDECFGNEEKLPEYQEYPDIPDFEDFKDYDRSDWSDCPDCINYTKCPSCKYCPVYLDYGKYSYDELLQ